MALMPSFFKYPSRVFFTTGLGTICDRSDCSINHLNGLFLNRLGNLHQICIL